MFQHKSIESLRRELQRNAQTVSLGHALRKEHKLKVRQPLPAAHLVSSDPQTLLFLRDQQHLIAEELNVKNIFFSQDETEFVSLKAKPNFRILGKKVERSMKGVQIAIEQFKQEELQQLLNHETVVIHVDGRTFHLDTHLSDELLQEGMAREIVNKINTMRREAQFSVTDRIKVRIQGNERIYNSFEAFRDYICQEVLAVDVVFGSTVGTEWDLNGEAAIIAIEI